MPGESVLNIRQRNDGIITGLKTSASVMAHLVQYMTATLASSTRPFGSDVLT